MNMFDEKQRVVIERFHKLLRSGMDYDVMSMYEDAGRLVCIDARSVSRIINRHYREVITQDAINFFNSLDGSPSTKIRLFSREFNLCEREGRLIIRYIKRRK